MNTIDKSQWTDGPWMTEPDELTFQTKEGYPATILRNPVGALCGYVGVPKNHLVYGNNYDDEPLWNFDIHGGLTYAGQGRASIDQSPDHWYFGFDCAHGGDLCPSMINRNLTFEGDVYRTEGYVREEIAKFSEQLAQIK